VSSEQFEPVGVPHEEALDLPRGLVLFFIGNQSINELRSLVIHDLIEANGLAMVEHDGEGLLLHL